MKLTRTTLRLRADLKKGAERKALEADTTLQEVFNRALESYLEQEAKREAKQIVFRTHNLGEALDNLTRDDYYDAP
ncbi:MAG: hypothetical protein A2Z42_00640 [Candidatus Woykebacteria bacterium RBG_19FT_COMBO_43_10]|uniref:Uncharacterized protein n=1 Tax=Candidatus Woykebacteria bacterium RBG_19FT_COMBO_43_10 TaxID=1802598 RepID=A0A1G1WLG4_9BACT|nr:MAG: hypothetical protein A2Z42_00640 [Candidatus Woykebacteria bacterium RBG_19FT_COMBO_43_10]